MTLDIMILGIMRLEIMILGNMTLGVTLDILKLDIMALV
jgi:hypothetical protein